VLDAELAGVLQLLEVSPDLQKQMEETERFNDSNNEKEIENDEI
jgi:hypothetical protein